jgi:hypothetical protein
MKLLKCLICNGEVDVIDAERMVNKKVKCQKCGFTNQEEKPVVEVIIGKRRPISQ